ncbi:hypothetical protein FIBSPDRAFT_855427 [Athelia psychrophila]|uniref:CENP-V/GFA domain-containing protein n=1 Tax=Athelia psychrophila TaxID=1759441 RepID=A0A166P7F0_9AGAM|nr:hypothetical protein FIBSPDRAFT_855427 [Fibularhizoctonia sp. CBS 109695]
MAPVKGGCYCGEIEFTIDDDAAFQGGGVLCHCATCQKLHTQNSYNLQTKTKALDVTKGKTTIFEDTKTDSGMTAHRHFCPTCGSHLYSIAGSAPDVLIVKVGSLENAKSIKPIASIYVESALEHSLLPKVGGIKRFEGMMKKEV